MPIEVILPRVDMDMAAGKISRWYVEEGQRIEKGKPLFEIETDKATMEIEAPASGVVRDIAAAPGQDMPVGARVAWIFAADEGYEALPREAISAPFESVPAETKSGARATPLARRLAREHGIDLTQASGSGPHGRIQSADILTLAETRRVETPATQPDAAVAPKAPPVLRSAGLNHVWLRQGEGRPVLMLHGFGSEANGWRPFLAGLDLRRPIAAIDLPCHGRSVGSGAASFDDLVTQVEDAVAALNLSSFDLVGHSLGGAVAVSLVARGAFEVRSLMLIAPAGLGPDINGAFLSGFARARSEASLKPWMLLLVGAEADLPTALVAATLKARANGTIGPAQEHLAAALFPDGTQAFSTRPCFDRLAIPTKIVFGLNDRIIPARQAFGLPGTVALHLFPNTGHLPYIERRAEVARLWTELLRAGG